MNRRFQARFSACLFILVYLAACEEPQRRVDAVETTEEIPAAVPSEYRSSGEPDPEIPVPAVTPAEEVELAPAEPALSVAMEGDRILISGALRSRIQQERIVTTMTDLFPRHKIESDLRVEYHRNPVGWGNRVAEQCLVPYFQIVNSPRVAYAEGIVTLEGEVKSVPEHRQVTEMAISAFSGDFTRDINNKIKVRK